MGTTVEMNHRSHCLFLPLGTRNAQKWTEMLWLSRRTSCSCYPLDLHSTAAAWVTFPAKSTGSTHIVHRAPNSEELGQSSLWLPVSLSRERGSASKADSKLACCHLQHQSLHWLSFVGPRTCPQVVQLSVAGTQL